MSAFTETALLKKLAELNSSQQSIQTLSLWLIHHRKHHVTIVKTWLRELQIVSEPKKLTYMYLANDVIQNSKKKGPEYGKEFSLSLSKVFSHIAEACTSEKLIGSLGRILNIWEERGVYDTKLIAEFRSRLNKEYKEETKEEPSAVYTAAPPYSASGSDDGSGSTSTAVSTVAAAVATTTIAGVDDVETASTSSSAKTNGTSHTGGSGKSEKREKRKQDETGKSKSKRSRNAVNGDAEKPTGEQNGNAEHQSPHVTHGEAPEPEELIKALMSMENSASSDAVVRERIANLPPELSEIGCINKLEDKEAARKLGKQVNEAVELLNEYNARLSAEMEDRTKLAAMLRDFQAEQRQLLSQAEQRLEEYKSKLSKMISVQREIRSHLSNLPDLNQLPDVTGGLAPLPSAGDLFNIH